MTDVLPATIYRLRGKREGGLWRGSQEGIEGAQSLLTSCIEATIEN